MIRLHFVVEGQTEETFVNDLLAPVLSRLNIFPDVRCVQTGRKHGKVYKGGITNYIKLKNDIRRWLKQDKHLDARFTTMFSAEVFSVSNEKTSAENRFLCFTQRFSRL
jgi:uncharacterized protein CbrC (UPF0167 family)